MTRVLALDCSTWWGSVALVECTGSGEAPRVVAEHGARVDASHSEKLVRWIGEMFDRVDWPKNSIDAYAATRGPGSFTGIRVGLGTIRGLSLAAGRPCFGVTTLEAIAAAHGPADTERVPLMEAGRGQLYSARYDAGSSPPVEVEPPWLDSAERVLSRIRAAPGLWLPGPGLEIEMPPGTPAAPERLAGAVGRIVAYRAAAGNRQPELLAPLYLRQPDAVLKRARE